MTLRLFFALCLVMLAACQPPAPQAVQSPAPENGNPPSPSPVVDNTNPVASASLVPSPSASIGASAAPSTAPGLTPSPVPTPDPASPSAESISFAAAREVLNRNCLSCHGGSGGVFFRTPEEILQKADRIRQRAIVERSMPLGRALSEQDYQTLSQWLEQGAPGP